MSSATFSQVSIEQVVSGDHLEAAIQLITEYSQTLNVNLCFQDFASEIRQLPGEYSAPRGCLLLATVAGQFAGVCCLRPLDSVDYSNACEMKRLFVRPVFRGLGVGRMLTEAIIDEAQQRDYDCILLDTLDDMEAARALYEDLGFEEIPPYYFNPIAGAHYLRAELKRGSR